MQTSKEATVITTTTKNEPMKVKSQDTVYQGLPNKSTSATDVDRVTLEDKVIKREKSGLKWAVAFVVFVLFLLLLLSCIP